jgi:hypothetical protein
MVGMDKIFSSVMHQRKNKQGLQYKTTTMKNTMYGQAKNNQGFIDLNCDAGKFQTLKKIHIVGTKSNYYFSTTSQSKPPSCNNKAITYSIKIFTLDSSTT